MSDVDVNESLSVRRKVYIILVESEFFLHRAQRQLGCHKEVLHFCHLFHHGPPFAIFKILGHKCPRDGEQRGENRCQTKVHQLLLEEKFGSTCWVLSRCKEEEAALSSVFDLCFCFSSFRVAHRKWGPRARRGISITQELVRNANATESDMLEVRVILPWEKFEKP